MDFLSKKKRSMLMSRVRGTKTKPELAVRQVVQRLGYKYEAYKASLPARPDLVFPASHKVILVHGCFWHRHYRCPKTTMPKSRTEFWRRKFEQNRRRDRLQLRQLRRQGWNALILWECQIGAPEELRDRIRDYLETP
jgi:DNA mismatch endonuclease, patch repair protein